MKNRHKVYLSFAGIVGLIIAWSTFLYFVGPREIVEMIGVQNGYMIMFLLSAFGGVSTMTSVSFYATLITLALGGLNPLLLGIVAGTGITIGDTIFFFLGNSGEQALERWAQSHPDTDTKVDEWIQAIAGKIHDFGLWLAKQPRWVVPTFVYTYTGLTPLPNDILTVSLGLSDTAYRRIFLPLLLGNITLSILLATLASQGIRLTIF